MSTGPLHVIANTRARRANRMAMMLVAAQARGLEPVMHKPSSRDEARELAGSLAGLGPDATVICAGGDGTFHTVVNGLLSAGQRDLPEVAIWPLGTANVTALELGIADLTPALLVDLLVNGKRMPVTVGRLEATGGVHSGTVHWFVQMASAGFDAEAVAAVPGWLKTMLGGASYGVTALAALPRYQAPTLTVTVDGAAHTAQQVVVANGRLYGGQYVIAPDADLTSATFEVCLLAGDKRRDLVSAGLRLVRGRYARGVSIVRGGTVEISADDGCAVQADGEPLAQTPIKCTAESGLLRLVAPADQ